MRPRGIAAAFVCSALLLPVIGLVGIGSPAAEAANAKRVIKVGDICSCTGPLASSFVVGPPALAAWAKNVDAHGGVDGYKIDVIEKDDQSNPGTSLTDAQSLIASGVSAIVDNTNNDTAWQHAAESAHVPIVGGGAVSALPLLSSDVFSVQTTEDVFALALVLSAKKVGATKIGDLYCAEAPACSEEVPVLSATSKAVGGGISVAYTAQISASQPNYTAQCLAAKQAGVDILGVGESLAAVEHVLGDCAAQGFKPWVTTGDGGVSPSNLKTPVMGEKAIGYETDIPFFETHTRGMKKYVKVMKKYAPHVLTSPNYDEIAVANYVTGLALAHAIHAGLAGKKGRFTTQDLYDGLYTFHHQTLDGMAPPLTFTRNKTNPVDCWFWMGIRNHKFNTKYGKHPFCEAPPPGTL